ncbi:MAG: pitrilysin family protein [Armatimonadota bacterium]|nr:pitrilysin family protein [Armatimonadota bacterium]MDR7451159.1 pitrilysin family protein [Armatimonadota bacterium]MDR7467236.1 pitrilysin family protein [Armatimonadota bacterium]MDR7494836.1 pitrilysin family protein [Armatimonadota bacterium]MDR7500271.1 pitrilysin family protein [Armatimonadota bacterium]
MRSLRTVRLANGLEVLLLESHAAPVATFWVWYRVGSRNEAPGTSGISHWVEHMLFKGTPAHPKGTLTRFVDRRGGRWNAFTWKDYTAYHEVLPAEHLPVAVELEADRMANTIFDPGEVESERTVIISEREGSENFPSYLLYEEVDSVAYKVHPYRIPVIGWKDDLRTITRDDLYRHYRTYYHPGNALVVAVGAFDSDRILDLIRRSFEPMPPGDPPPPVRSREPEQEGERRVVLRRPGGATAYLQIAYHVPAATHPDLAALLVIDGLLSGFKSIVPFDQAGGGRSSRLYRALVERQLATDVTTSVIPAVDPTLFRIMATVRAGADVRAVEEAVLQELERLARDPVPAAELAKVKKQAKAQFVFARDGVFRTALALGAFAVVDHVEAFPRLLERIAEVDADAVQAAAARYFVERHRTTGWYLPEPGGTAVAAPSAAYRPGVFGYRPPPQAGAPAVAVVPDTVTRGVLANGLTVLAHEQPGSGMVAVHGYVKAGALFDGGRSGLARFVASLLQRGTLTRSSQQIAEALEGMGASLTVLATPETVSVALRVLAEDAPAALEIVGDLLMRPAFPPEEVEKVRGELLTGLRITAQDTRTVAERAWRRLVYPEGHPHRQMVEGEEAVIQALTPEALAAFHRQHYRPEATILTVVGDRPAGDILELVARVFTDWPRQGVWRLPHIPPAGAAGGPRRVEVRLPGKVQSDIVLGGPGLARNDPAYYDAMVANLILGQIGMMGRLGDSVRERQGMAYYAYSDLRAGLTAGPWWVRAGVNPRNEARAIDSIVGEIRLFQQEGPTGEELSDARNFLIGSLALRLETNGGIAQTLADIELYALGLDYLVRYPEIIRGITPEGVTAAAQRFPLDGYAAAVAGPPPG